MQGTVTVYFNTGFNGVDIPAEPSVLATASKKSYTYDIYYMREDIDKPCIRIMDTYENLCAVDYCSITTTNPTTSTTRTSYYFASPTALTRGVTMLALDLDALLTMGGAKNLVYISGWQERGHIAKSDDVLFGNIAAEEWVPTQPLVNANIMKLEPNGGGASAQTDFQFIISNIDIVDLGANPDIQDVIAGVYSISQDEKMYFPKIKSPLSQTTFWIYDFDDPTLQYGREFTLPQTLAYVQKDPITGQQIATVKQGIEKLFSCGQLQLQSSYEIPKEYIDAWTYVSATGEVTSVTGFHGSLGLSSLPFEYTIPGYTVKNKKVFSSFRQYAIVAVASGDICIKNAEDIYKSNIQYPTVDMWADPCCTGKPYARFNYIKGAPYHYVDCVRGLQWNNSQLVLEGASGSMWNSIDTAFANQRIQRQMSENTFNAGIVTQDNALALREMHLKENYGFGEVGLKLGEAVANIVQNHFSRVGMTSKNPSGRPLNELELGSRNSSAGFGAAGAILSQAERIGSDTLQIERLANKNNEAIARAQMANQTLQNEINQNNIGLLKNNNVVAPTIMFTPEQNLGLYGYNYFMAYEIRKSDEDLKSEDMYYQRYGYNGLHRPLTAQCFNERQYYNYVQAFDINLKAANNVEFGLRVRTKAISQLNKGVRVWKVLPDASYYDTN